MKGSFVGNTVRTLGSSGGVIVLGVITSIIITRALGPEGKGVFAITVQAISVLIALGQFGLPEVMLYQMRAKHRRPQDLAGNSFLVLLVSSLVIATILWIIYPLLSPSILKGINHRLIQLIFLMVPFNLAFIFYNRLIQLSGHIGTFNLMRITQAAVRLVGLVVWLQFWHNRIEAAILGLVSSQLVVAVVSIYIFRGITAKNKWRVNPGLLWESIRSGMKVQVGIVAVLLGNQLGIFVLNRYLDLSAVGWFSTAIALTNFLLLFSATTRDVLQSWIPDRTHTSTEVLSKTLLLIRHSLIVLIAGALVLAVLGRPLINLMYGTVFNPAYAPMLILLIGIIARGVGQIFTSYIAFEKRLGLTSIAAIIGVGINAGLALWLVPQIGMIGAAVATMAGQLASLLFLIVCFIRLTNCSMLEFVPGLEDIRFYIVYIKKTSRLWANF